MKKNSNKLPRSIFKLVRDLLSCATLAYFLVLSPAMAFCEGVTLAWDASKKSDLKGYIHYFS